MKLKLSACIKAPKEKVWQVLSDVSNVHLWVGPILSAHCEGRQTRGVGTTRVCQLQGNMQITETWIAWDEGHSFTYQTFETAWMKSAKNTWSMEAINGDTLLTTESEIILKGGIVGKLFEPLMLMMSKSMGANSLAAFKHLVEVGRPYKGNFSSLPRVPIEC